MVLVTGYSEPLYLCVNVCMYILHGLQLLFVAVYNNHNVDCCLQDKLSHWAIKALLYVSTSNLCLDG